MVLKSNIAHLCTFIIQSIVKICLGEGKPIGTGHQVIVYSARARVCVPLANFASQLIERLHDSTQRQEPQHS